MSSVNRFIQFNNETIDTKMLLEMEMLAGALADAPYLKVTMRKLTEFRPVESAISMSVFWKHRTQDIERSGYLSDIYLMSGGFWRNFNLKDWRKLRRTETDLPILRDQLLLCAEEFRLSDLVKSQRPGTAKAFQVRDGVYSDFHAGQFRQNRQKGFLADAFLNEAYLKLRGKSVEGSPFSEELLMIWTNLFDAGSTKDSAAVVEKLLARLEVLLDKDSIQTYYTFGEAVEKAENFYYHEGIEAEPSNEEEVETIEEWFQAWHRESESDNDSAMEFELERGESGKADSGREEEGSGEVEQTAQGDSSGEHLEGGEEEDRQMESKPKSASGKYGAANEGVVFQESRIQVKQEDKLEIENHRNQQAPYVRALLKELQKRMTQKRENYRTNLDAGRLSKKLISLAIEERPKPFYRKTAPSKDLDAVFCLLIDGSASMIDKIDETKQAVLLFHDVLRALKVPHEIVLFYEDAYEASEDSQPNYFEWIHKFEDGTKDHAREIFSLEAHEDNRDGFAIRWMNARLRKRAEKHKFMLVFSDGEPSAYNYAENGIIDTANAVSEANKQGVEVLHLFLSGEETSDEQAAFYRMMYGNKSVSADSLEQFAEQTLRLLKRTLHLVIQSS